MLAAYVLFGLSSVIHACAPTTPVSPITVSPILSTTTPISTTTSNATTSTINPSSTTSVATTTVDNITTTTPVPTTTNVCCSWPLPNTNVNTATPNYPQWDQCNQNISYYCSISNSSSSLATTYGIAVNIDVNNMANQTLSPGQYTLPTQSAVLYAYLTCDPATHLWRLNGANEYSTFACAYQYINATWFWGAGLASGV